MLSSSFYSPLPAFPKSLSLVSSSLRSSSRMHLNVAFQSKRLVLGLASLLLWSSEFGNNAVLASVWQPPASGYATLTHYTLPTDYIASCGCTAKSTHYPTAALNALAFGSTQNYGPGCGRCYRLEPINTFLSSPPWYPAEKELKSIVIKVTDLCPSWSEWCQATPGHPNQAGNYLNFDLAFPSIAIPDNFFPSNESYYGYSDFGVWNATFEAVSCSEWAGWSDPAALGSVTNLGDSVCCPSDTSNATCPSFSEEHGDPVPWTGTSGSVARLLPFDFGGLIGDYDDIFIFGMFVAVLLPFLSL